MQRKAHPLGVTLILVYAAVMLAPIAWMLVTSFKDRVDTGATPPAVLPTNAEGKPPAGRFKPTLENYREFFGAPTIDPALRREAAAGNFQAQEDVAAAESAARDTRREFVTFLQNSLIVAVVSTFVSVFLGAFAAYGFSRFKLPGSKDWQFFILSTRMLPAMAVAVPISWMYYKLGLFDTSFGLILLYTCFNLSFSTWMMKAFIDEIPRAYEEAALLDGYTRVQVLFKIVLPQAGTGLMATSVFCLIASWNEYAFALTLAPLKAQTLPVYLARVTDRQETTYGLLAAGAVMFMLPIVIFSLLMRKHLLRGITFGAVKG